MLSTNQSMIAEEPSDFIGRDLLIASSLAVIGGYDARLRIGGLVSLKEEDPDNFQQLGAQTGILCKISAAGKTYIQDDFGSIKKFPITSLTPLEEISFNPFFLPDSDQTTEMWVELLSMSVFKINIKDWNVSPNSNNYNFNHEVNIPLLRLQLQLLLVLKTTKVLFKNQLELRKVLKQAYVAPVNVASTRFEGEDELSSSAEEDSESDQVDLVVEKVLARATQPSPIKAIFSRNELEEAAVALFQHLASSYRNQNLNQGQSLVIEQEQQPSRHSSMTQSQPAAAPIMDDIIKSSTTSGDNLASPSHSFVCLKLSKNFGKSKHISTSGHGSSSPLTPSSGVVKQLMEMGFSRKVVENSIKILSTDTVTPSPETLVAWMLEHQGALDWGGVDGNNFPGVEGDDDSSQTQSQSSAEVQFSDSDSLSEEFEDIDASDHDCCIQSEVYKKLSDFPDSEEYAAYVREHVSIGMTVRLVQACNGVFAGDVGKVGQIERNGLHDLNVMVSFFLYIWGCCGVFMDFRVHSIYNLIVFF